MLDANISPKIGDFLYADFGLDVESLLERGVGQLSDDEVIALAKQEQRVLITLDKDFAQTYYLRDYLNERSTVGVIALDLRDQRTDNIRHTLARFFSTEGQLTDLSTRLVVLL